MSLVLAESGGLPSEITCALIAMVVSLVTTIMTNRGSKTIFIHEMIYSLIELSLQYPYLEDDATCNSYPNIQVDQEPWAKTRYENYCCHVFNTLEHAWEHTSETLDEVRKIIYPDELIVRHRKWWLHDEENNSHGYSEGFVQFVQNILDKNPEPHPRSSP